MASSEGSLLMEVLLFFDVMAGGSGLVTARRCEAWRGKAWQGRRVRARPGLARSGEARRGAARHGRQG
jgi:hypothetical protein